MDIAETITPFSSARISDKVLNHVLPRSATQALPNEQALSLAAGLPPAPTREIVRFRLSVRVHAWLFSCSICQSRLCLVPSQICSLPERP